MRSRTTGALLCALTMGVCCPTVLGQAPGNLTLIYVKRNPTSPAPAIGDGRSWDEAYADLWVCLEDLPNQQLDEFTVGFRVHVAEGEYDLSLAFSPGLANESFLVRQDVWIFGGYEGESGTPGPRDPLQWPTVLTGRLDDPEPMFEACDAEEDPCVGDERPKGGCNDIACCNLVCTAIPSCCDSGWDFDCVLAAAQNCPELPVRNVHTVVRTSGAGNDRRLDGITITDGGTAPYPAFESSGGGLALWSDIGDDVGLQVVRCRIVDNRSERGGGIAVLGGVEASPCDESDLAALQLWNSEILDNRGELSGAGIFVSGSAHYEIVNSVIARNAFVAPGPVLPSTLGGGLADVTVRSGLTRRIVNSTIVRNSASEGSAIGMQYGAGGACPGGAFDAELLVANTVVRNNLQFTVEGPLDCADDPQLGCEFEIEGDPTLSHCLVFVPIDDEAPEEWTDCIDADPAFVEIDHDPSQQVFADYRLTAASPCVDAGDNAAPYIGSDGIDADDDGSTSGPNLDLDLMLRIQPGPSSGDPVVDIGAYELVNDDCTTGDLNGDGVVDGADLGLLLSAWGECVECEDCPPDLNRDCVVNGADLGLLLSTWGGGADFPRTCGSGLLGGGGGGEESQSQSSSLTLAVLADALGFESTGAFVAWLIQKPMEEIEFWLSLLG